MGADLAVACPLLEGIDLSGARARVSAKVEALSSNGMDEIEIPASVRKQAG